jgi:hypothetical protein
MPTGHSWKLTDTRLKKVELLLREQMSIASVAYEVGVSRDVLIRKLKEQGHDFKMIRRSGLESLQRRMFKLVSEQADAKDEFDAGMKYLSRYQKLDDEVEEVESVDTEAITADILKELS